MLSSELGFNALVGDFPCCLAGKNLPAMKETWVRPPGWEDPLEKGKATHSSILFWRIPWISPWGRKESDTTEQLSLHFTSYYISICDKPTIR